VGVADDNLFLTEQHPVSTRHAVLDDNGFCCWFYLTEPGSRRPVADVWLYNRINAPAESQVQSYRPSPPPAAAGYAGPSALISAPKQSEWSFLWSVNGQAAAVLRDGEPLAFIRSHEKLGYCRLLVREGPWGMVWTQAAFEATFGRTEGEEAENG
jgi:hypothetical protein